MDYGKMTYRSNAPGYPEFIGEITEQYVKSIGYLSYDAAAFKKPYLSDDFHSMMYLFTTAEDQITGEAYGGRVIDSPNNLPRANDKFFDNSAQVASLENFNSYAVENYKIMGKLRPKMKAPTGVGGAIFSCEGLVFKCIGGWYGGTVHFNIYYADWAAQWFPDSQEIGIINPNYAPSTYSYKVRTPGSIIISNETGLSTIVMPPLTIPPLYSTNYVYVDVYVQGQSKACATIMGDIGHA